jgi:predicted DNA-binding protein
MAQTTVRINSETYQALRAYSEKTDVPVSSVLTEAAERWLKEVAPARLKALTK